MSAEELAKLIQQSLDKHAPRFGFPVNSQAWEHVGLQRKKLLMSVAEDVLQMLFPTPVLDSRHLYDEQKQCVKCMSFINEPGGGPDEPCPIDEYVPPSILV